MMNNKLFYFIFILLLNSCQKNTSKELIHISKNNFLMLLNIEDESLNNIEIRLKFKNNNQIKIISFTNSLKPYNFQYEQENNSFVLEEIRIIIKSDSSVKLDYIKIKNNSNIVSITSPNYINYFLLNKNSVINPLTNMIENTAKKRIILTSKQTLIKNLLLE